MSLQSFFGKSFGCIALLVAILPSIGLYNSIKEGDDAISIILIAGAVLFFAGLGIGLLIASVDRPRRQTSSHPHSTLPPAPKKKSSTVLIGMAAVGIVALVGIAFTSFLQGDSDADRSGINMLWWCVERVGIWFLIVGAIYALRLVGQAITRRNGNSGEKRDEAASTISNDL